MRQQQEQAIHLRLRATNRREGEGDYEEDDYEDYEEGDKVKNNNHDQPWSALLRKTFQSKVKYSSSSSSLIPLFVALIAVLLVLTLACVLPMMSELLLVLLRVMKKDSTSNYHSYALDDIFTLYVHYNNNNKNNNAMQDGITVNLFLVACTACGTTTIASRVPWHVQLRTESTLHGLLWTPLVVDDPLPWHHSCTQGTTSVPMIWQTSWIAWHNGDRSDQPKKKNAQNLVQLEWKRISSSSYSYSSTLDSSLSFCWGSTTNKKNKNQDNKPIIMPLSPLPMTKALTTTTTQARNSPLIVVTKQSSSSSSASSSSLFVTTATWKQRPTAALEGAPWQESMQSMWRENNKRYKISTGSSSSLWLPDYLWVPPSISTSTKINNPPSNVKSPRILTTAKALVYENAIVQQQQQQHQQKDSSPNLGYGKFQHLGNYELLCFIGNQTMAELRETFLQLRPQIFPGQRPFKFHCYDIADLQQPDRYWTDETKKRIRKCKHMLVAMEEFDMATPISQRDYHDQIINFVGHLLRVMNDDTFPIRILTWIEPAISTKHCHSPFLPWTNDHPCNDVLHHLFHPEHPVFPSRVKLLDNTDLTLPWLFGNNPQQQSLLMRPYILAAIALRLFVVAGEQVSIWRAAGQHGAIDGLHRNGKVEPNFELVPYVGWGERLSLPF